MIQLLIMAFNFLKRGSVRSEKPSTAWWKGNSFGTWIRIFARLVQFVLGIVVIGLYAQDLDRARKAHVYIDSKWVWSVVCGTLGSITALIFMLPLLKAWFFFYVDAFIFLCYLVAFGIFGKMYIPENPEGNGGIQRMKNAVWVLLANMLLWFFTSVYGAAVFWKNRKARTSFTGRAEQHP
jgi:ABC-type branched-subunit amino acid transport system permease subunit